MEGQESLVRGLFRRESGVPTCEADFLDMVYRSDFRKLTDQFSSGQLAKFESHPFMERVVQHALLLSFELAVNVNSGIDGGSLWISISAKWPSVAVVNAVLWHAVDAHGVVRSGVIERKSSSSHFAETIPVGITSRIDLSVAFGVMSPNGSLATAPEIVTRRVKFQLDEGFEKDFKIDHIEDLGGAGSEVAIYRYQPKKFRLPQLVRWVGVAVVVSLAIYRVVQWL